MGKSFSRPFANWFGINIVNASAADHEAFNAFYDAVHLPESIAGNGYAFGHRYELERQDPRGELGPRYLTVYEAADQATADASIDRSEGRVAPVRFSAGPLPVWGPEHWVSTWRMNWRRIHDSGVPAAEPHRLMMIGLSPPAEATDAQTAALVDFYTTVHAPEVRARRGFSRTTLWERYRSSGDTEPESPRFVAVYEIPDATPPGDEEVAALGSLSDGPEIWESRDVSWRLYYRRIGQ